MNGKLVECLAHFLLMSYFFIWYSVLGFSLLIIKEIFRMAWKLGVFLGEASATFVQQFPKRTPKPTATEFIDAQVTQSANNIKQITQVEALQLIEKAAATIICSYGPTVVNEATFNLLGC